MKQQIQHPAQIIRPELTLSQSVTRDRRYNHVAGFDFSYIFKSTQTRGQIWDMGQMWKKERIIETDWGWKRRFNESFRVEVSFVKRTVFHSIMYMKFDLGGYEGREK